MKNNVIKTGIKNTIYVIAAQSISLILGIARTLLLPVLLGITNFGYWQVYLLYMSYVGIFALGFNDGIYLKYGNYEYDELPKEHSGLVLGYLLFSDSRHALVSTVIMIEPDSSKQLYSGFNKYSHSRTYWSFDICLANNKPVGKNIASTPF